MNTSEDDAANDLPAIRRYSICEDQLSPSEGPSAASAQTTSTYPVSERER